VLEELPTLGGTPSVSYVLGDDVLSQASAAGARHLLYDGHGSTRLLTDAASAVTDRYSYDAYGMMLGGEPGVTDPAATNLLYSGEQFDADLGWNYQRARYYDMGAGRWNRVDPWSGDSEDPQSLHKYLYCHGDPVTGVDPSGLMEWNLQTVLAALAVVVIVAALAVGTFSVWYRATSRWGIKTGPSIAKKRFALVRGPAHPQWFKGARDWLQNLLMGESIGYLAHELREAGHTVDVFDSPDENALIDILNDRGYAAVGLLSHATGPAPGRIDVDGKPVRGLYLGGDATSPKDAPADPGSAGTWWSALVTANELEKKVTNPQLELVLASCYTTDTTRYFDAIKPKILIGVTVGAHHWVSAKALKYIVYRANGEKSPDARDATIGGFVTALE